MILGNLEGEKMETPFNFEDGEQPAASNGGGKLPEGRYNFEFVRVAGADDNAENGIVTGKMIGRP